MVSKRSYNRSVNVVVAEADNQSDTANQCVLRTISFSGEERKGSTKMAVVA